MWDVSHPNSSTKKANIIEKTEKSSHDDVAYFTNTKKSSFLEQDMQWGTQSVVVCAQIPQQYQQIFHFV